MSDMMLSRKAKGDVYVARSVKTGRYVYGGEIGYSSKLFVTDDVYRALSFNSPHEAQKFFGPFNGIEEFETVRVHRKAVAELRGIPLIYIADAERAKTSTPTASPLVKKKPPLVWRLMKGLWKELKQDEDYFRVKCIGVISIIVSPLTFLIWGIRNPDMHAGDVAIAVIIFGLMLPTIGTLVLWLLVMLWQKIVSELKELADRNGY